MHLLFSCHPCVTDRVVILKECYILSSHLYMKMVYNNRAL